MPRRKFVYDKAAQAVVEITAAEHLAQCAEITADVAARSEPLDFHGGGYRRADPAAWPRVSDTMGCHPAQIRAEQEELAKHGVQTDYTREGQPIFRDQAHRRKHMEALDFVDADAGYGDRAPTKFTFDDYKALFRRRY